jgi:large subunit ribosomal protein L4
MLARVLLPQRLALSHSSRSFASTLFKPNRRINVKQLNLPKKAKAEEEKVMANQWATTPFAMDAQLDLPVYSFITGNFTRHHFILDHQNFNQPLRRDIVARVFRYFEVKGKIKTKMAKTKGDVAGSGKKPAPQKGRGAARVGNKRAPQRKGGGAAHGPKMQDLTEKINKKTRLLALRIMLSARLYEDKIVVVDSESIKYPKTRYLEAVLSKFKNDRVLFLTGFKQCSNFMQASSGLQFLTVKNPQQFNVPDLMRSDIIFMTKQGLQDLELVLEGREANYLRNRVVPSEETLPHMKYIHTHEPKSRQDPDYEKIIKPIKENELLENIEDLE